MRGLICLVFLMISAHCYAFEAQSSWGAHRAQTPLNRERLISYSLSERDRVTNMCSVPAASLGSPNQHTQAWVVEPRIPSEQRMISGEGERTSLKRDACACIFVAAVVGFITWILMHQKPH